MLRNPVLARALPFAIFIVLMMCESLLESLAPSFFSDVQFALYPARVFVTTLALVWLWIFREKFWPSWKGMPASSLLLAVVAGIAIIVFWIAVGPLFRIGTPSQGNPIPQDPLLGPLWLLMRFVGATLLVPIIEELFWRSYLTRRVDVVDVDELLPKCISWKAMLLSSIVFAMAHSEVVAGFVAGLVFCLLYKRRGDLREAVVAHAVANALLFAYVVKFSAFEFWG